MGLNFDINGALLSDCEFEFWSSLSNDSRVRCDFEIKVLFLTWVTSPNKVFLLRLEGRSISD